MQAAPSSDPFPTAITSRLAVEVVIAAREATRVFMAGRQNSLECPRSRSRSVHEDGRSTSGLGASASIVEPRSLEK